MDRKTFLITITAATIIIIQFCSALGEANFETRQKNDLSFAGVTFDLYYPVEGSKFPLILYSAGAGGGKSDDVNYAIDLARSGYCCLWSNTQGGNASIYEAASKANTEALFPMIFNTTVFQAVTGLCIDSSKVALTGGSSGGGAMMAINDSRVATIVGLVPYYTESLQPVKNAQPVLICCGQSDPTSSYDTNGMVFYNSKIQNKMIIERVNYAHDYGAGYAYELAWLNWLFKGNETALNYVLSAGSDPSVSRYKQDLDLNGIFHSKSSQTIMGIKIEYVYVILVTAAIVAVLGLIAFALRSRKIIR